ncbi:MAG: hypothetical protein AAGF26_11045 [Cyanobacteria bacterium P01_G01_bin.49]
MQSFPSENNKLKEKTFLSLEKLLCPKVISALTPLVIAAIGGTIGMTVVINQLDSPEAMGLASSAIAGAAGLARSNGENTE